MYVLPDLQNSFQDFNFEVKPLTTDWEGATATVRAICIMDPFLRGSLARPQPPLTWPASMYPRNGFNG